MAITTCRQYRHLTHFPLRFGTLVWFRWSTGESCFSPSRSTREETPIGKHLPIPELEYTQYVNFSSMYLCLDGEPAAMKVLSSHTCMSMLTTYRHPPTEPQSFPVHQQLTSTQPLFHSTPDSTTPQSTVCATRVN